MFTIGYSQPWKLSDSSSDYKFYNLSQSHNSQEWLFFMICSQYSFYHERSTMDRDKTCWTQITSSLNWTGKITRHSSGSKILVRFFMTVIAFDLWRHWLLLTQILGLGETLNWVEEWEHTVHIGTTNMISSPWYFCIYSIIAICSSCRSTFGLG